MRRPPAAQRCSLARKKLEVLGGRFSVFTDVDDYEAALPVKVDLLPTTSDPFRAELTWVDLTHLHLLHAEEALPRVARISLSASRVAVFFPTHRTAALTFDGVQLQLDDIVLHSPGERFHQCTGASCAWGAICLSAESLLRYGRILTEQDIVPPPSGQVLRASPRDRKRLLRVHAEAARIARTDPDCLRHREVARALDQDLIWALVICLANARPQELPDEYRRCARILADFDDALAESAASLLHVPDGCRTIGVSERMLRRCCSQVLGMGLRRYLLLHQNRQARRAPRDAGAEPGASLD